jgi:hypothetical protein
MPIGPVEFVNLGLSENHCHGTFASRARRPDRQPDDIGIERMERLDLSLGELIVLELPPGSPRR